MVTTEVTIPVKSFLRLQYLLKVRKDFSARYNRLLEKNKIKEPKIKDMADEHIRIMLLCSSIESEEWFQGIKSIVPKNCNEISKQTYTSNKSKKGNDNYISSFDNFGLDTNILTEPHFIICSNNDIYELLQSVYPDKTNIYFCSKGEIGVISKIHLERYALSGMKRAFEILHKLLNGENVGAVEIEYEGEDVVSIQRPLSEGAGVKEKLTSTERPSSENLGKTRSSDVKISDEDKGLKSTCINFDSLSKADKELVERLHDESIGIFNRSILPKDEKPSPKDTSYSIDEKLLQQLKQLDESIESCGYRRSTLQVNVKSNKVSDTLTKNIDHVMKKNEIKRYSLVLSGIDKYSSCSVGQKLKVYNGDKFVHGTLGGFAKIPSNNQPCAILSRHVAKNSIDNKVYVVSGDEKCLGEIMKEFKEEDANKQYLDIAAATLDKNIPFDTRYITEEKVAVSGKICSYDPEKLRGLNVHIKGANSHLGLGTITVPEQNAVDNNTLDVNHIIVEDRQEGEAFCKPGDSGAIVCAENPDKYGEEVQLISMVIGENINKKGSYATLRLDKGLEHISSLTQKDFLMY